MKNLILAFLLAILCQGLSAQISGTTTALSLSPSTATVIDPAITVGGTVNLTNATVQISNNYYMGDVLAFNTTLATSYGITGSYSVSSGVSGILTFTGTTTPANWQVLFRTVTFQNTAASCGPSSRSIVFIQGNYLYNSYSQHFYQYVNTSLNWVAAKAAAAASSYNGMQGYLATITSADENNFVWKLLAADAWIGGSYDMNQINTATGTTTFATQAAANGNEYWVTGPEAGTKISTGLGSPVAYNGAYINWNAGEPNNAGNEYYTEFYSSGAQGGKWNDLGIGNSLPYVVEYGGMPNDIPQDNTFTRALTLTSTTGGDITGGNVSVCSGTNSTLLTSTAAVTGVTIVQWEYSLDNFLTPGIPIANTSATYTATNLTQTTYFRSIANGNSCAASPSSATKITVGNSVAGTISADYTTVCNGSSANLSLAGNIGNILKWQSSPDNTNWTDIANVTPLYTTTALSTGTYYYRAQVQNTGCTLVATTASIMITATVGSGSVGGTLTGASLCTSANSATLTLTGYTGVIQKWQSSANGGATWTDIANTNPTYAVTNLAVNTNYRVSVKNASCNAVFSSVGVVTVSPLPTVSAITGTASVCVGNTTTLADATSSGVWSSANTAVATVDVNGVVTGVAAGSSVISYAVTNSGGCTTIVTNTVTVNAIPVVSAITGATSVCVGGTTTLSDVTTGGVWSSSNTGVASIDVNGNVTGVALGTSVISYTVTNGSGCTQSVTQTLTINDLPVVAAVTGSATLCAGSTTTLTDATPGGVWSSSNTAVATVDINGVITGIAGGTSDIIYSVTNGNGCTQTATQTVTVNSLPVISAITGTADLCIGTTTTLSDMIAGGVWSSSNTAVAMIDVNGMVTGISGGTSVITYTVTSGSGCTQSVTQTVTVSILPVVAAIAGSSGLCVSSKIKLSDPTPGGFWTSSNTSVATVDPSGFVTGVSAGSADINYNVINGNGCAQTATTTITVNGIPAVEAITGTATVCTGLTTGLSDLISGGLWSSSDAAVATIDATGIVTGISAGSADITYTIINGGGCSNAVLQTVTVNTQPVVPSITGNSAVCTGNAITLTDAVSGGVWSSSSNRVATVDANGNVTGNAAGTADITYTITVGSGCSNAVTQTISVMDPPDVAAIAGSVTVVAGNSITLSDATTGGTWSSGNTNVATVDANGNITGVAEGNAVISYTVTNAGGCSVMVSQTISTIARPAFTAAPEVTDSVYFIGNPQNPSTPINQIQPAAGASLTFYNSASGGTGSSLIPNLPSSPGTYAYWVSQTENGMESPRVSFKVTIVTPDVFVPKVFTPNGDGINDIIKPIIPGLKQFRFFKIYNRWGNLVYSSQDPDQGWDGTLNGSPQPRESYMWMIEGVDMSGQVKRYSGMITLFR